MNGWIGVGEMGGCEDEWVSGLMGVGMAGVTTTG